MTYRGHVENGVIQLQDSVILPEGAEVRVELAAAGKKSSIRTRRRSKRSCCHLGRRSQGGMGPAAGGPDRSSGPLHLRDAQVMRKVFADTLYWIATVKPNDPYEPAAREARQAIGPCLIVTTDEVLASS